MESRSVPINITERRRVQEEARERANHLHRVIGGIGAHMFVGLLTPDGHVIEFNRTWFETGGLAPGDILGRPFEETFWGQQSATARLRLREAIGRAARGEATRYDEVLCVGAERLIRVDFSLHPVRDGAGAVAYLVTSGVDVTARERAECIARSLTEIGQDMVSTLDVLQVAKRIARAVIGLLGVRRAVLFRSEGGMLVCLAGAGEGEPAAWVGRAVPAGMTLSALAVAERRPTWSADIGADPRVRLPQWMVEHLMSGNCRAWLSVPVEAEGQVIGALSLGGTTGRNFAEVDVELVSAFAQQAAVALRNAELFAESEARRREAEVLAGAARMVGEGRGPAGVAAAVADALRHLLAAPRAVVYRLEPGSGDLVRVAGAGFQPADPPFERLAAGTGMSGLAVRDRRTLASADSLTDPRFSMPAESRGEIARLELESALAVPLLVEREVIGLLFIRDRRGRNFAADEIRLAEAFAAHAAVALDNVRLWEEAERRQREAEALAGLARALAESLSLPLVGERIVEAALALLPVESAWLRLVEPEGSLRAIVGAGAWAAHFEPGHRLAAGADLTGRVVAQGRTLTSRDVTSEPGLLIPDDLRRRNTAAGHKGLMTVPLRVDDRVVGVLSCAAGDVRDFSEEEVALAEAMAGHAALGIERARLYAEAVQQRAQAESLEATARELTEDLDAGVVGQRIVDRVLLAFGADFSGLRLTRLDGSLELVARAGIDLSMGHRMHSGEGLAGQAVSRDTIVVAEDYLNAPHLRLSDSLRRQAVQVGLGSGMAVPLRGRNRILGALTMGFAEPRVYPTETASLLEAFAGQAAVALDNAQLYEEARQGRHEAEAVAAQLRTANTRLEALSHRLLEVQEIERRSIARELHDQIGQELTALKLGLRLSARRPGAPDADLDEIAALADDLIDRVRTLSLDLRPAMLDDLGLRPALEWLIARHGQSTKLQVSIEVADLPGRPPPEVETAAFRIVQEALTNVARHARTDAAAVRVRSGEDCLTVEVVDGGRGFDVEGATAAGPSTGLSGMQERAVLLGGRLEITSSPGAGTRVLAELPLAARMVPDTERA